MTAITDYPNPESPIYNYLYDEETGLLNRIEDKEAELKQFEEEIKGYRESRQYNLCCVEKSKATYCKYLDIDNAVAGAAAKESKLIKVDSDGLQAKQDAISAKLVSLTAKFRQVKAKIKEVSEAACALPACLAEENSCNKAIYDEIVNSVYVDLKDGKGTKLNIHEACELIKDTSEELLKATTVAIGTSVDISGIQTFTHIDNLKQYGVDLYEASKLFREDVISNIGFAHTKLTETQAVLITTIEKIAESKINAHNAQACINSMNKTLYYVKDVGQKDDHCDDGPTRRRKIDKICKYIYEVLDDDGSDESGSDQGKMKPMPKPAEEKPDRGKGESEGSKKKEETDSSDDDDFWS